MTPLAAYAERLSVRPGETIRFRGRCERTVAGPGEQAAGLSARIVQVRSADPNPEIGGVQVAPVAANLIFPEPPTHDAVPLGSYAVLPAGAQLAKLKDFTWIVSIKCTRLPDTGSEAPVMAVLDGGDGVALAVTITDDGQFDVRSDSGSGEAKLPCAVGAWTRLALAFERTSGTATLTTLDVATGLGAQTSIQIPTLAFDRNEPIRLASYGARWAVGSLDGYLEAPMLFDRALDELTISQVCAGEAVEGLVAAWDFGLQQHSDQVIDVSPNGLNGQLVNSPTRGVRGVHWSGREMAWRHAPDEYAAIHFHSDDIDDCGWPCIVEWQVPATVPSGAYALELSVGEHIENVPFWIVPPKAAPAAKIAVLVSTFTYTVYGNHARPEWSFDPAWQEAWREQTGAWSAYPHNPGDHADMGLSTYNTHADGSGIAIASWHRPMLNLRLGYLTYPNPEIRGSGLRHYPADSHLTLWLEAKGFEYDVITDWELHHEGNELLRHYPVVMTGSHPEYHTREMLDALGQYRDGGGRLCYLGGNGFYWKIALCPYRDGVIEIRRAEGGIRAWAAEPGEYYNQFDGEYGGLWRRNGRPPQDLTGVGFSAQGNFVGSPYHIAPAARASRAGWIFDGIAGETFGDYGLSGRGAAGFELDRADFRLGTPGHAVVLASSQDHPPEAPWVLVPEERLTHLTTLPGESDRDLIRADMVFFETGGGKGAVFSTGSITYCGALPVNDFDNDVSKVTENVVRRFLDPAPFTTRE